MTLTYSLFLKSILDAAGAADRINDVLRYRSINAVMAVWNPNVDVDKTDVEGILGFKLSDRLSEYVDRIINTVQAAARFDKSSCIGDLYYFSEIARSIEDARQSQRAYCQSGSEG